MKVFTRIFVLDSLRATFDDMEQARANDVERFEMAEEAAVRGRQVASLQLWIDLPENRTGTPTA